MECKTKCDKKWFIYFLTIIHQLNTGVLNLLYYRFTKVDFNEMG